MCIRDSSERWLKRFHNGTGSTMAAELLIGTAPHEVSSWLKQAPVVNAFRAGSRNTFQ